MLSTFFNVVAANTAPAAEVGLGAEAVEEVEAVEALDVPDGKSPFLVLTGKGFQ